MMTLHLGDARDINVRDAALIVTDFPYELTSGGKSDDPRAMSGGWMKDYDNKGKVVIADISWADGMALMFEALAPVAHAYVFCNNRHLQEAQNAATHAGFYIHNVLVWNKRTATANRWYMKNCEFVLFLGKGPAFKIGNCSSMACVEMFWPDETIHPNEKPWPLLQRYIRNSSEAGATVFDPFMGSGSTGVAAAKLGRDFIGIELEQRWFDIAKERIEKAEDEFQKLGGQAPYAGAGRAAHEQLDLEGLQRS
ncbi:site-specific DNA-methyltransferase [uncultured Cohaesibacter sp.]|uniref:DNA-methyltransferase n=1 Tax=uncultured Cohaesibacter sp. TaxID=1002546 RepID=UPI0029C7F599|nr:site-specific DNA-methyltransferase [uncultured Cohaesibacter sp.]